MSDNVVTLGPRRRAEEIWVCGCGCSTFFLRGDGESECSACGCVVSGPVGRGWWDRVKHGPAASAEPTTEQEDGPDGFAERRAKQQAGDPDVSWLMCGTDDGRVTTWASYDPEAREWLAARIASGRKLLLGEAD